MNDLLKINNLSVSFNIDNKVYQAVKNLSLNIALRTLSTVLI